MKKTDDYLEGLSTLRKQISEDAGGSFCYAGMSSFACLCKKCQNEFTERLFLVRDEIDKIFSEDEKDPLP